VVREIVERKCRRQDAERALLELTRPGEAAAQAAAAVAARSARPEVDSEADETGSGIASGTSESVSVGSSVVVGLTAEADMLDRTVQEEMERAREDRAEAVRARLSALDLAADERRRRHSALVAGVRGGDHTVAAADAKGESAGRAAGASADESVDVFMQRLRRRADSLREQLRKEDNE
jgi:hypothetical protein